MVLQALRMLHTHSLPPNGTLHILHLPGSAAALVVEPPYQRHTFAKEPQTPPSLFFPASFIVIEYKDSQAEKALAGYIIASISRKESSVRQAEGFLELASLLSQEFCHLFLPWLLAFVIILGHWWASGRLADAQWCKINR